MKRDTLIQMARQAGLEFVNQWHPVLEKLEKFAELVAEHEREECAKVCDDVEDQLNSAVSPVAYRCASVIRARGGK